MSDLVKARKRLTDLVDGLRSYEDPDRNVIHRKDGKKEKMTVLQARVFTAYARQIERVVLDDLQ
jgi:hypothetical protein